MWRRCSICQKQLPEQSNWDSSCVKTFCLFEGIVTACNSAVVVVVLMALVALVAVDLAQSWLPIQSNHVTSFFCLKHPFVFPWQKASLN